MKVRTLQILLVFGAFLVLLHQFVNWGTFWQMEDLHHESFALALVFGASVLWVQHYYKFKGEK